MLGGVYESIFLSSMNKNKTKCNDEVVKCQNINFNPCSRYCCVIGPTGPTGPSGGPAGSTGATGPAGPSGTVLNYADFYALMPPDNSATVASGTDVSFPQDGPNSGASITRTGASSFNLSEIGTYQVFFNVPVSAHLVIIQIA